MQTEDREIHLQREALSRAESLSALVEQGMPAEANIRLEVTLISPRQPGDGLRVGLRIGEKKWYVVKDIAQLLEAKRLNQPLSFQSKFIYEPSWMRFREEDLRILRVLEKMLSVGEMLNRMPTQADARLMPLPEPFAEELLETLQNVPMRVMTADGEVVSCPKMTESSLPLRVEIRMTPRGLHLISAVPEGIVPLTKSCAYALYQQQAIIVPPEQRPLLRMMLSQEREGPIYFDFPLQATEQVVGEVIPYLKRRCAVEMSEELRKMLVRLPLQARVYLDREGKGIAARVAFLYGRTELNPFAPAREKIALEKGEKLLLRDAEGEHAVLEILANAGFRVTKENLRLMKPDDLFAFLAEGVHQLEGVSEIFLSRDFRKMYIRRPTLRGGLKMERGSLLLNLNLDGEPTDEIMGILEALSRSRRYYRMKDGTFLNLSEMQGWQEAAENLYEAAKTDGADMERDALTLRGYRTGYLARLLEEAGVPVDISDEVRETEEELTGKRQPAPAPAPGLPLRDYQIRGYEWMYMLDRLHMGGILADDMGLGKTIQIIALLRATQSLERTSLIVAPTSLTYNWLSEINRFAPELSAVVVAGTAAQRESLWRHVTENSDVDVAITSYPLIRRDIGWIEDYAFRFAVLDEAQNIKNAGSIAASTVKRLRADTRLALTGTPMENGIGELWSIFDFVLPGYLQPYHVFLRRYQDGMNSEDLRTRIRPFLTRRLKQEVLEELPDKVETRLTANMTPEQRNVYQAAMERLRQRVRKVMTEKGFQGSRMEILSAITELREICCHPSLVLDGYTGSSGKEEMLLEILPGLIDGGRRVLIFSQFTSMLKILRPRLTERGIRHLYLDGDTPAGERLEMTRQFNEGDTPVFLISLRAGGSGLNLRGADVVIHYDPWWNPATEEQATDRAHRIGQTKKVDVLRLVMGDSIEEKVVELGERKKALFDRLITPGESGLAALTEQDVRELFS